MDLRQMDLIIYEILRTGNVISLRNLLHENELFFDRFLTEFVLQITPLHIAILHRSVDFAREILCRKPQLAHVLNSQGFSPLHMASANGSVDIVSELLPLIVDVSHDRDSKGWTPVHAAAMKGHVDILKKFNETNPEWIRDITDRDETVLHLCVKYNDKLAALKMLIPLVGRDNEFVNRKDVNGNTILHLAAMKKHKLMIKHVSTETGVEINAANMNGFTALDVFTLYPSNSADRDTAKELRKIGAERSWELSTEKAENELKNVLMLVGTLTATLCFQAALVPPGGLWQDDSNMGDNNSTLDKNNHSAGNHTAGTSILADKDPRMFLLFQISNYLVFYVSLSLILVGANSIKPAFQWKMLSPVYFLLLALAFVSGGIYICNKVHTPNKFPHYPGQILNQTYSVLFFASIFICCSFFIFRFWEQYQYSQLRRRAVPRNRGSNVDTGNQQHS